MQIPHHTDQQSHIQSINSRLTSSEKLVRNSVMELIIDSGRPVTPDELMRVDALLGLNMEEKLEALLKKRTIVVNPEGCITFSYPVSALPTHHRVSLADGRTFHAMCAVDALGATFTFNQDIRIDSQCSHCSQSVHIVLHDQGIVDLQPAGTHILHVDLERYDDWSGNC
jgi:hypothetical protein